MGKKRQELLEIADRLSRAVRRAGGKKHISELTGIPLRTLGNYTSAQVEPTALSLAKLSSACVVSVDWLLMGGDEEGPRLTIYSPIDNQSAFIRELSLRRSDSNTLTVFENAVMRTFPKSELDRLNLKPEGARLLKFTGAAMHPTIADGDPLLLDITDTEVVDGRIYAFAIGDQLLVKRLRRRFPHFLMRSDNRELYPEEEEALIESVRIVGRVRWVGRGL